MLKELHYNTNHQHHFLVQAKEYLGNKKLSMLMILYTHRKKKSKKLEVPLPEPRWHSKSLTSHGRIMIGAKCQL